jgi:hypothetical protein
MKINMNVNVIRNDLPAPFGSTLVKTLFMTACLSIGAQVPAHVAGTNLTELSAARSGYVVQAPAFDVAVTAVKNSGGTITQELRIINAVVAQLSVAQASELRADRRLNLMPNG